MLAPVRWDKNAWPVVNGDGTLAINMKCQTLPQVPMPLDPVREEFNFVKRDVPADSYSNIGLPWGSASHFYASRCSHVAHFRGKTSD